MYVDPSRVEMALRYETLATHSPARRAKDNVEVLVFLASLWADATNEARTHYKAALERQTGSLPWAAFTKPAAATGRQVSREGGARPRIMRGPPIASLLLGQEDPEDEGVEGYRLIDGQPRATAIIDALYAWDVPLLTRMAKSSGWRLEEVDEPDEGESRGEDEETPELAPEGPVNAPVDEPGEEQAPTSTAPSRRQKGVVAAGVAAGFALVGLAAWRLG